MATVQVTVTTPGLTKMLRMLNNPQATSEEIAAAWSILYQSFCRARFATFSRGGGDWAPLSPATIKRRRKGKAGVADAILRDTGALFASLLPAVQGGILQSQVKTFGLRIILGGGRSYKNGPTLSQVASFHHRGDGHLPAREILVAPDSATITKMAAVAKKIVVRKLNLAKQ